jgi:hypothetical protein
VATDARLEQITRWAQFWQGSVFQLTPFAWAVEERR